MQMASLRKTGHFRFCGEEMIHPSEQKRTLHRITKRLLLGVVVAAGLLVALPTVIGHLPISSHTAMK
jgi:hypothetical protein